MQYPEVGTQSEALGISGVGTISQEPYQQCSAISYPITDSITQTSYVIINPYVLDLSLFFPIKGMRQLNTALKSGALTINFPNCPATTTKTGDTSGTPLQIH